MNEQQMLTLLRRGLIVLLLATALLLLSMTGYGSGMKERLHAVSERTEGSTGQAAAGGTRIDGSAFPIAAAVCDGEGGRFGTAYHGETVMAVFHRFSAELGEALGSAGAPTEIEAAEFRAELSRRGVTLRFGCVQPMELLSAWLGIRMTGPAAGFRTELVCLWLDGDSAVLSFQSEDGRFYRCATAAAADAVASRTAEYEANGARFAFELPELRSGDDFALIQDGPLTVSTVHSGIPLPTGGELDALLQSTGMNSFVASSYAEADGTVVFVDEEATLRMSPSGAVFFRSGFVPEREELPELPELVSRAWQIAEQSIGRRCGDAELLFSGLQVNGASGGTTVYLDYAVNGIPVHLADGHAAEITLLGTQPVQLRLQLRSFTVQDETETLLPALQAMAIAARDGAGAELVYTDGGERMSCVWVKTDG